MGAASTDVHSGPKAARIYRDARAALIAQQKIPGNAQQILVLRDGFSNFGTIYKADADLVCDWDEDSWAYR